ncbi:MAG: DUF4231 domain-containing protein [Candidatus Sulfotelmatobacter sp.]|jgi:hypothetical protein
MNAAVANLTPNLAPDPIIERLEDQIGWYDLRSRSNMQWYKRIKITEIVSAAVIPFLAASHAPHAAIVTGVLGIFITVFEGLLQLNQFHENWIRYRSTCEALRHEKYIFLANAAPYSDVGNARAVLAERVESLVSQEHAKWASVQQQAPKGNSV